nr:UvrD-helicase domain-containing protein [Halobacterium noricense]
MVAAHGPELNSYFENPDHEHTDQQFRAIFSNDNYNRVNAAAGTGKTTTFGRRVRFILSEYDDVSASDLLAFTFTRNGRDEMEAELEETFGISGVDIRTINSYSKAVAEDQYSDLEFVIGEAKQTEIASIWRDIESDPDNEAAYERFLDAWKDERYDPNDIDVVNSKVESLREKSSVTIQGEELATASDEYPEAAIAHQVISRYLTARTLEYDFETHVTWATSPSGGYTLDFELLNDDTGDEIYVEYCVSDETRDDRPRYRNSSNEKPETVRRLFTANPEQEYDPSGKTGIVLNGNDLLEQPSDEFDWDDSRAVSSFEAAVEAEFETQLKDAGVDVSDPLEGQALTDYVYDRMVLYHEIVDKVGDYINQARVREWDPEQARQNAASYLEAQGDDVEAGVPEFVELSDTAYRAFTTVFDNRTKTDFHGSVVLTRDLLVEGEVDEEYRYPYVFVDEMQDLNQVQFGVVKHLAEQLPDVRVFGVGDDWQSIFGFQGARPDLFINFGDELGADEFDSAAADPVEVFRDDNPLLSSYEAFADTRLEDNYRCPQTVVTASNAVIENNEVRTEKRPSGLPGGDPISVHHLGCDTFPNRLNRSMIQKVKSLIEASPHASSETQVLLRQKEGDASFYYRLKDEIPGEVDIRTAHDAKGSQAEHVVIPKVIQSGGYPSVKGDKWVDPVDQPPEIYDDYDVSYQLEEERRLFYVALTRAKSQLDVLTVQGAESVFVEELPDAESEHFHPLSSNDLREIQSDGATRRTVTGAVDRANDSYATLVWNDDEYISVNLFDATDEQKQLLGRLADEDQPVTIENCRITSPTKQGTEYSRLQLEVDETVTVQSSE